METPSIISILKLMFWV